MIELIHTENGRAVAAVCDSCGQRIKDCGLAVVVAGPSEQAMFAHKGRCHASLEARYSGTADGGFIEFSDALAQVIANSGGDRPA
jgi:hypothetical protein